MIPLVIYNPSYSGILFNTIELIQKLIDQKNIDDKQIYFYFNNKSNYKDCKSLIKSIKKRYNWTPIFICDDFFLKNGIYNYMCTLSPNGYGDLKHNGYLYNKLFIIQSGDTYNWLFEYLQKDIHYLLDLKKAFFLHNPLITVVKKNYKKLFIDENFTKNLLKCFQNRNTIKFVHGIYTKYYNENIPKINKYYIYLEGTYFFLNNENQPTDKNFVIDPKENPFETLFINETLQWCKQNNIDVDVNIPCINPAYQYDGLIYCREFEYCSRLINEFLYYKKPIWIMKYNEGLDYYIPNAKELEYPFLLERDYIEIDVEDRFVELVSKSNF